MVSSSSSSSHFPLTNGANFQIRDQCTHTIWAAASPGGGCQLNPGESWTLMISPGTGMARIWGRTGSNFEANGRGRAKQGTEGGLLVCQGWGQPPNTLAEYARNQFNNLDFFDISLVDGFNIPMAFNTVSNCREITCNQWRI